MWTLNSVFSVIFSLIKESIYLKTDLLHTLYSATLNIDSISSDGSKWMKNYASRTRHRSSDARSPYKFDISYTVVGASRIREYHFPVGWSPEKICLTPARGVDLIKLRRGVAPRPRSVDAPNEIVEG